MHATSSQIPRLDGRQTRGLVMEFSEGESWNVQNGLKMRPSRGRVGRGGSIARGRWLKARGAERRCVLRVRGLGPACCSLSI